MRIRILPPSSYGFRRLAKVLALVAFFVNIGYWVHETSTAEATFTKIDAQISVDQENQCYEDHTQTPSKTKACVDAADKEYHEKASSYHLYGKTWREIFQTWVFFSVIGLFWSFVTALIVRTMGFIALGFSKPAQS